MEEEISSVIESQSQRVLQLEEFNFKIDSTGWKKVSNHQGIICLENQEEDVWEYIGGVPEEFNGQQLFTNSAGIRETKKVDKRVPTHEEWTILVTKKEDILNLVFVGFRDIDGVFYKLSFGAGFWTSSISNLTAWYRCVGFSNSIVHCGSYHQLYGMSIRCLING